jgi:predicted AlkP superfamily pyrophosphatase or phosphodiesterase
MSLGKDMRSVAPTVCAILGLRPPRSSETEPLLEVVESMGPSGRLAVVVIDALGVSTWINARIETPALNTLANRRLLHLRSVMPTITPVNFATMLTGASAGAHTIRDRSEELKHETIFDALREKGGSSATAARALSSLGILISPHADEPGIAESNTDEEVTRIALEALGRGVDLVWVQLLDVDDAGHAYGPQSSRSVAAVKEADAHLREIALGAREGGYGLIVLADHGQHTAVDEGGKVYGSHGTEMDDDIYVPLVWATPEEVGRAFGLAPLRARAEDLI